MHWDSRRQEHKVCKELLAWQHNDFTSSSSHHCGGKSSSSTPPSSSTKKKNKRYYWQHVIYGKNNIFVLLTMHWDKLLATTNAHCSTYLASISISDTLLKTPLHKQTWRSQHVASTSKVSSKFRSILFFFQMIYDLYDEQQTRAENGRSIWYYSVDLC